MQIVIEIDDKLYEIIKNPKKLETMYHAGRLCKAVNSGKVLPKGHGRLGDLDKIKKEMQNYHDDCAKTSEYTRLGFETAIAVVEDASPIIEADKTESKDKEVLCLQQL